MATVPTFEDLVEAGQREALSTPTRLTPEIIAASGSDVNIAFASQASMAEKVAAYAQGEINATRLRTAGSVSDGALEQFGASEFGGEVRRGAEAAIVPITFTRDPGGSSITIAAGFLVATSGGVTFETIADLSFDAGAVGPRVVTALATTSGEGGNVAAGTITLALAGLPDLTLVLTNAEPASGGQPEQSIDDYQAQLESVFVRARRGTLGAIEAAAATTPGVASARAFENLDSDGKEVGRVTVQILGGGGTTNSSLAERVFARVREFRCAGVPVSIEALNPRTVRIVASGLLVDADLVADQVLDEGARSLVALVRDLQVGSVLRLAAISGLLESTPGLGVPNGSITEPTDDVAPAAGEFLVTTLDDVLLSAVEPEA